MIDSLARKFLKKNGLDYPHGTGHGVGYFLNVHEGPIAISKGFLLVSSSPLTRSSYHADEDFKKLKEARINKLECHQPQ